jgi:hypothetical protein
MTSFQNAKQNEVENGCAHKRRDAAAQHHLFIDFEHDHRASQAAIRAKVPARAARQPESGA